MYRCINVQMYQCSGTRTCFLVRDLQKYEWLILVFSSHSFRNFLPEVSATADPPDVANLNALELLRHAQSTLSRSSHLAPADLARQNFVVSATSISRVYVTNKTMSRLIKISIQQLNRVHRALSRPDYVPSPFGGWDMLEM